MGSSDRPTVASILDRARRFALDIEGRTSLIPLPAPDEQEQRLELLDTLVTDALLRQATRRLFRDGYYAQAVTEAYKVVNNTVKTNAKTPEKDGTPMMMAVFDRAKPILRINAGKTQSDRDEQEGYKFIFAGAMMGIRNPRSHLHDLNDEAAVALEMIVMANHLLRTVGRAVRPRKKKGTA
jgi:uncharacterized protein (TIGR02391 family)